MEGCRRKLKCLSIREKVKIIEAVNRKDKSKKDIAKEFDIPVSTLSTILKKKDEILTRFRIGQYSVLDRFSILHRKLKLKSLIFQIKV